jgi:hypothetical protein
MHSDPVPYGPLVSAVIGPDLIQHRYPLGLLGMYTSVNSCYTEPKEAANTVPLLHVTSKTSISHIQCLW